MEGGPMTCRLCSYIQKKILMVLPLYLSLMIITQKLFMLQSNLKFKKKQTESPSQYRSAKNVYFMRRLAVELQICIRLSFTESGHGKSACDGVEANIITQFEEMSCKTMGKIAYSLFILLKMLRK